MDINSIVRSITDDERVIGGYDRESMIFALDEVRSKLADELYRQCDLVLETSSEDALTTARVYNNIAKVIDPIRNIGAQKKPTREEMDLNELTI